MDGRREPRNSARSRTPGTWDDAAADRYAMFEAAVGRPAYAAIVGLHRILGPSGMLAYLTYMAERLEHCHRLLKPTGSLYLHCDPTASHYLKIVLDAIFGAEHFRNEIVWKRSGGKNDAKKQPGRVQDRLLFYGGAYYPDHVRRDLTAEQRAAFTQTDPRHGPYKADNLTAPEVRAGESGRPWRGFDPGSFGRHWGVPNSGRVGAWIEAHVIPNYRSLTTHQRLDALDAAGLIHWPQKAGGWPLVKRPLHTSVGTPLTDLWDDVPVLARSAAERLGYPTQKPRALLERIIAASSNPGDLVLDPFCGCGTTVAAARALGRRWAGIDISPFAVDLIRARLADPAIPAYGMPADLAGAAKLAAERPFDFETWAVTRLAGGAFAPNERQVGDGGVDGRATLWEPPEGIPSRLALAQVKGGKFSLSMLRDFAGVLDRERAALGCYVTLDPVATAAARREVADRGRVTVGGVPYPRLQPWSIAEHFDGRPARLPLMADPYTGKLMQMRLV